MKQRPNATPYDFDGEKGETATITILPTAVGNTFVVSKPALLVSGGDPDSDQTEYEYVLGKPPGEVQVIQMKFRFPEAMPANLSPKTWPRFDIHVRGSKGEQTLFDLPDVLQSSVDPVPSEQTVDLSFRIPKRASRKKTARRGGR